MAQNQTNLGSPTKPYGNSPKSLSSTPAPEPSPEELAAAFMKSQSGAAQPAAAEPTPEELAAQFVSQQQPVAAAPTDIPTGAATTPQDAPGAVPVSENGASFLTQARASLAANDTEKINFLKQQFGSENARLVDGKLEYRKNPGEKFRKFNSTVVNDFIDSLIPSARDVVKEVALVGPEGIGGFAGGVAGSAAPVVGNVAGAVGGATLARVAATPAVNRLADAVAEFAGIPQDKTRNKEMENVIQQSVEALTPAVAKIGGTLVRAAAKQIPGTSSYAKKVAGEAAKDVFDLAPQSQEVLKSVNQLREAGLSAEILNSQLHTESAPLQKAISLVKDDKQIQAAQIRVANDAKVAIEDTFRAIVDTNKAAQSSSGRIGEQVLDAAKALRTAEGAEIGALKNKALKNTNNGKLPVPENISGTIKQLTTALGFDPVKGTPPRDLKALGGQLGITKPSDIRAFSNALSDVIQRGKDGTIRYSDLDPIITQIGNLVPAAQNYRGAEINRLWSGLAKDARVFKNQAIEAGLQTEAEKTAFRATNARYGALLDSVNTIDSLISDDMGSHIVVDKLLGSGKEAVGNAKALKAILPPATYEKLKGDWVEKQLLDFRNTKTGNYNAAGISDYMNKTLGPEFVDVLFDGDRKKLSNFKAALTYGQRVADTTIGPGLTPDKTKKIGEQVVDVIKNFDFGKPSTYLSIFGVGEDKKRGEAILAVLGDDGFRRYVAGLPKGQQAKVSGVVNGMYDYAVTNKLIPAARSIQDATGRVIRQDVRNSLGTTGGEEQ